MVIGWEPWSKQRVNYLICIEGKVGGKDIHCSAQKSHAICWSIIKYIFLYTHYRFLSFLIIDFCFCVFFLAIVLFFIYSHYYRYCAICTRISKIYQYNAYIRLLYIDQTSAYLHCRIIHMILKLATIGCNVNFWPMRSSYLN